jgi:integrase
MLARVMKEWLASEHPGGPYTFCHGDVVSRSRKRSRTTGHKSGLDRGTTLKERLATVCERVERLGAQPLSKNEAHYHFKKTLADSKWKVLRGWHVFRHSLASNLAAAGERQEVIDKMLGHVTEEMRRRYRHLLPKETTDALQKVFGD